MKKTVLLFFALVSVLCTIVLPVQAQAVRHQWYCKHVSGHAQPSLDQRLAFIEEHNAYYIDRHHTNADADDKVIYLTFDAGYENGNVEKTLDILREQQVPAAFFQRKGCGKACRRGGEKRDGRRAETESPAEICPQADHCPCVRKTG